ncbi:enoyl-CoA hydratase/isomerase family protein [Geobacter sp. AOG1]|uniref:enoyl-CoA hydratase/isomerase family protein n=1 Tax=Geobacter sp. AOG1 TaxID=1566346 RepID=UPI001CC7FE35|nr:enoyl-CoA hydratase/isomerase family protein [Geobacter sp. AOG1]GFE58895.1 crotonase [Geobacter sp. AOG1]
MPYKKLHIEIRDRVGYILMQSGSRFNKLSITTLRELKRAFGELEVNPAVTVIVLSGYPGESFAVGADIAQMRDFGPAEGFAFAELGQSLFAQMEECGKPIIGALNGITMGGGCDLAMACDIRLGSDALLFAHPGAKLGIITGFCGTQKLPRLVGKNFAREIFMTSESYTAADGLRMGFLNRLFPAVSFWDDVVAFAGRIAAHPAEPLLYGKKIVNASEDVELKSGCVMELGAFSSLFATEARAEKMQSFLNRKKNHGTR